MKQKYLGKKRIFISIVLTMFCLFALIPFYADGNMAEGLFKSRYANKTARIEISNRDSEINTVKLLSDIDYEEDEKCKNCLILTPKIESEWKKYKVKFQITGNGNAEIKLGGPEKNYPVFVDYRKFNINGKSVFIKKNVLSHSNSFNYGFEAKNGDVVEFEVQIKRSMFKYGDLLKLIDFNYSIFFSVLILSFLFSYKTVQYIAKFKILENNSRIDIAFCLIFLVLLFIPMSHISDQDKSFAERRMFAKFPQAFKDGKFNYNYTKQFENWFNDRFGGRKKLIKFYHNTRFNISDHFSVNLDGRDIYLAHGGWIFDDKWTRKFTGFSDVEKQRVYKNFSKLIDFFEKQKIKFYFFISPTKGNIYSEYDTRNLNLKDSTSRLILDIYIYIYIYSKLRLQSQNIL